MNNNNDDKVTIIIIIFLSSLFVLAIFSSIGCLTKINALSVPKEKTSLSSSLHHNDGTNIEKSQGLQFSGSEEESDIGTKSSNFASVKNDSPEALAIAHHLYLTSTNASNTSKTWSSMYT